MKKYIERDCVGFMQSTVFIFETFVYLILFRIRYNVKKFNIFAVASAQGPSLNLYSTYVTEFFKSATHNGVESLT